jgi:hypothetical protein
MQAVEIGCVVIVSGQAFREFYADPRYTQMLVDFKLDPASTAKINVPDLPF